MDVQNTDCILLQGPKGSLEIQADDKLMCKIAMLVEVICFGKGSTEVAKHYGYKKQRYYQILQTYKKSGSSGLIDKKKGPKHNGTRTESVINQILRYKFLDPALSAKVIVQKFKQRNISICLRSVERTFAEYGLQKKNSLHRIRQKKKPSSKYTKQSR